MAAFTVCFRVYLFFVFIFTINAAVIQRRGVINHDAVVGFAQAVPDTPEGVAYLKFKPWLDVPHGELVL